MRLAWLAVFMCVGCAASFEANVQEAQEDAGQWHVKCPESTRWNGEECVWRYVITDVKCPKMAVWDGNQCVSTHVACPDGAAWDGEACVPIGERPRETASEAKPARAGQPVNSR